MQKLAEVEDLEERGLFLRLPCKVNDIVYAHSDFAHTIVPYEVDAFHLSHMYGEVICIMEVYCYKNGKLIKTVDIDTEDFGKTVFLTRAEAEMALLKEKEKLNDIY